MADFETVAYDLIWALRTAPGSPRDAVNSKTLVHHMHGLQVLTKLAFGRDGLTRAQIKAWLTNNQGLLEAAHLVRPPGGRKGGGLRLYNRPGARSDKAIMDSLRDGWTRRAAAIKAKREKGKSRGQNG